MTTALNPPSSPSIQNASSSASLSNGVISGIVVGAVVGAIMITAIIAVVVYGVKKLEVGNQSNVAPMRVTNSEVEERPNVENVSGGRLSQPWY